MCLCRNTQNKYFYNPDASCEQWWTGSLLSTTHIFSDIFLTDKGVVAQLSLKEKKKKNNSDFYAIDIFIAAQNIFGANPPPGAPVGCCTLSRPYKNALK